MNKKILLIGGSGYIGSIVAQQMINKNYNVISFDNLIYNNFIGAISLIGNSNYSFINGDLNNFENNLSILQNVSDVVILGGLVGDPITKKYPKESDRINEFGIQKLFKLLKLRGINKVIFISTCSNYGKLSDQQFADENFELNPLSKYAIAKVNSEKKFLQIEENNDYHPVVLRFATAFGLSPRMRFDLTINQFVAEAYFKKVIDVFDADTWRPYCHVMDFAKSIIKIIESPNEKVAHQIFNIGNEKNNLTKRDIVSIIKKYLPDTKVNYLENGLDARNYRVSFNKVKKYLNLEPQLDVDFGVVEILEALEQGLFNDLFENLDNYGNYKLKFRNNNE